MNKAISVWLILQDGENKGKVVLQKRSSKDSFPFVCQATWAGKVEQGEDESEALVRECREELGENFCERLEFPEFQFICKGAFRMKGIDWESYNYFGKISEEVLKFVKMHDGAFNNFVYLSQGDEFYPVESGKNPEENVVLFDDQYVVLKKIFNDN